MEFPYLSLIALLAGTFFLVRSLIFLASPEKLKSYLETSPKATIWRQKFGPEKTLRLAQRVFMPLAIVVSLVLISVGTYTLLLYYGLVPNLLN